MIGSKWKEYTEFFFESHYVGWVYSSGVASQYGALTDPYFGEFFDKITADAKTWRQHMVALFTNKPSLDMIFRLIAGNEGKNVSDMYDPKFWHLKAPTVKVITFTPNKIEVTHNRLSTAMHLPMSPSKMAVQPSAQAKKNQATPTAMQPVVASLSVLFLRFRIDWEKQKQDGSILGPVFNEAFKEGIDNKGTSEKAEAIHC